LHLLENHSDQITDKEWIKKMIDAYGEKYKNHDALAMMEK
jgi:hypothetical protein